MKDGLLDAPHVRSPANGLLDAEQQFQFSMNGFPSWMV